MKKAALVVFGCLVPGGAYLLMRRYVQFAVFASAGSGTPFATTPCVRTYWPVSIVERAGIQTVFWLYARR